MSSELAKIIQRIKHNFLIDCPNKRTSDLLARNWTEMLPGIRVKVSVHRDLNHCKGVIRNNGLKHSTVEEILGDTREQGVVKVERCFTRRGGIKIPTNTFFLTFDKPNLPSEVQAAYYNIDVSMYIPRPLQCYSCFKFGHISSRCKAKGLLLFLSQALL